MPSGIADAVPFMGSKVALPLVVALSCAFSTGLLIRSHLSPEDALYEVPPEMLVRAILSNNLASPLRLHWQGKQFGSALLQAGASDSGGTGWMLRLGASGRLPGQPDDSPQWSVRFTCHLGADGRALRTADMEIDSKEPPLLLSATSNFEGDRHEIRISNEEGPVFEYSGNLAGVRDDLARRFGWKPAESVGAFGAAALKIIRGRVEPSGRPIEVFFIRDRRRDGPMRDFLCVVSLTGQPLYFRLPGGFEALPDGVAQEDLSAFKNLK